MPEFLQPEVEDKAHQRIVREIAIIEGEWPAHTSSGVASGYCTPNGGCVAASGNVSLLISVPSSTWFKPRTWWIDNENAAGNHLMVYAGGSALSCTATLGGLRVNGREIGIFAMDCITCGADLWIDALQPSCHVRVGGLLLVSAPEN
jgi:hypothetical protein